VPSYVYKCSTCERVYQADQKMAEEPYKECPECKDETLHRVPQPIGIAFKGSGFHVNDYPKWRR
jgi:putative FmdB family regulatory protein